MSKIVVANWKMNLGPHEASLLVGRLAERIKPTKKVEVVLCPPVIDLFSLARDQKQFKLGAQNIHWAEEGTYTGEISASMLKGLAQFVIVGHSERRAMGEEDADIAKKVATALRHDLTPVLCVGDTLLDREHGHARRVVSEQVTIDLSQLTQAELKDVIITYEPVWAISKGDGKGSFAAPDQVEPMVRLIRQTLDELHGEGAGNAVKVLYGGSVNPENAAAYLSIDGIDGFLVGGASLNYEQFTKIVEIAEKAA